MRSSKRRLLIGLTLAMLGAAIVALPAWAAVVRIDSKVNIGNGPPAFHGKVRSDNNACERRRRVKLYRQRRGPDKLLGSDKTNHDGRWEIEVEPLSSGAYYAKVTKRSEGAAGTIFVCRGDRSKTVVVD
jgi:hypothetical protein